MTNTWHIHLSGLVQGVGFRPFVVSLAAKHQIRGTVANGSDGVHVYFNATAQLAKTFYHELLSQAPAESIITHQQILPSSAAIFEDFSIVQHHAGLSHNSMLITPDRAPCPSCLAEINDPSNRRYRYAFTTCLHCGPRYSIMKALPFEREHTRMDSFDMCPDCLH
ncbi:MAG: acylphosphatase, partial [Bacteroidota bacterium]|nr:acylphosphatase [Bacteroidota bacterium]